MRLSRTAVLMAFAVAVTLSRGDVRAAEAVLVKEGQATAAIWHGGDAKEAASDLALYLKKMSGAELAVKVVAKGEKPPNDDPAVVLGALALDLGLPLPPRTLSQDGYRIQTRGSRLLMAGESARATSYAVTHFLETLGCRWLMGNKWGEVIPEAKTVLTGALDIAEKPDFAFRSVWGFDGPRTRTGGMDLPNRHDWEHCPPEKYFKEHPEYYALRGPERRPSRWVCTSNPDVARIFADAYIAKAKAGMKADTLSPPDGRGFCECDKCRALDVPDYIEPSSGTVSMSDRYVRFFDAVGRGVKKEAPDFILSFYCYSDYTLPPRTVEKVSDNLCGWVTTIRFCRIHGVNNPNCESRQRYRNVVEGWSKLMRAACYDYNYNLAEVAVPISKIAYVKDNLPFLKKTGCLGLNMEAMAAWNLYGPHTYLATRLMWNADADADAILDDYYTKLCGKAAPHVKAYWERIDKACREADVHAGSFYGLHVIWTPERVRQCEADLDAAAKAAETDLIRQRVALFRSGLESARFYLALREATNRCDFKAAKQISAAWLEHMDRAFEQQFNTMAGYKRGYVQAFLLNAIESGCERTTGERKLVAQLPDEWQFRYDPRDEGEKAGWDKETAAPEGWTAVKTYSATLNEQKIKEQLTWMWYRCRFTPPADLPSAPLHLWFGEVDGGQTKVFLNGQTVGDFAAHRNPGEVEISGKLLPGKENVLAVKTDHRSISELFLGGILRPVMIYAGPKPPPAAKKN